MGIFDYINIFANVAGLYSFISDKLRNDEKAFNKQIKRTIKAIYKEVKKSFGNSKEYKFPPDTAEVIYDEIIKRLENKELPDIPAIQLKLDIPNHICEHLMKLVLERLYKSLRYAHENYEIWVKQEVGEISKSLYDIKEDTRAILKILTPDSAYLNNRIHKGKHRFHYTSGRVGFVDRDKELVQLKSFCGFNEKMEKQPEQKDFLWWQITGEGGSGKSRLCYEFSMLIRCQGWTICYPPDNSCEYLQKCSDSLPNNTLFVLDYSEYNTSDIFEWISQFGTEKYKKILIRVLLIQRKGDTIKDIDSSLCKIKSDNFIKDTAFNGGEFLKLSRFNENDIMKILKKYAEPVRELKEDESIKIYELLKEIDENLRPLFAIVLIDAYLEEPTIVLKWDKKEEVLKYICDDEIKFIKIDIVEHCGDYSLLNTGLDILTMATMVGGIDIENELEKLLPEQYAKLQSNLKDMEKFCQVANLFSYQNGGLFCYPLEPDIIGEYFVIYHFEKIKEKRKKDIEKLLYYAWSKPYFMSRFVNRLFQDFSELLYDVIYHTNLTSIKIPDSVTNIEDSAFKDCINIISIEIPDSVINIGNFAFAGCRSLTSIEIPDSVTNIGYSTFGGCTSLTSIEIPDSTTNIEDWAFEGCISLTSMEIPDSVTNIGESAFSVCMSLTSLEIPYSVTNIGYSAFSICTSLMSIEIPDSVNNIEGAAFFGCTSLKSIKIPDSVTNIGSQAFEGCTSLTSIKIPDSVTNIEDSAFWGCTSLTSIEISDSVTNIGDAAFWECTSLTSIEIPDSVTNIGDAAFWECTSLTSMEIPDSVVNIGDAAFWGCTSLTSMEIPDSVANIGDAAFEGCTSLMSMEIPDSVTNIGDLAFMGCTSLTSIEIPDSVINIGDSAFYGCSSLKLTKIPASVTSIGDLAFFGCNNLTSIEIPNSITNIDELGLNESVKIIIIILEQVSTLEEKTLHA